MEKGARFNGKAIAVVHEGYTDLGDYLIDMGEVSQEEFFKGMSLINEKIDTLPKTMCTGIVKRNKKGEVILGRNEDLEVSNYPAFISHIIGGKYKTIAFYYNNKGDATYEEFKNGHKIPDGAHGLYAASASDAFNEAGLYMQCNMRWGGDHPSTGTNPGKPRVAMGTCAALVAMNCATVAEAIDFLKTEVDVYSAGASKDGQARGGWDGGYMIGDATGEYGVIEFANNQLYFTPYANGHCNAFVSPILCSQDRFASGYGRLAMAQTSMIGAETAKDMMEAIHKADWRREIEDIKYSYKDEQGRPHFVDKDGNPSIDYRCEATMMFPVDDEGHLVKDGVDNQDIVKTFDKLREDVRSDKLLPLYIDTEKGLVPELEAKLLELNTALKMHYMENCTSYWLMNDKHFDDVKTAYMAFFGANNAFELIEQFNAGDEKAIRDKGDIFTTGMNFGVNCAQKYLMVRFWEHDDCIYEYQW